MRADRTQRQAHKAQGDVVDVIEAYYTVAAHLQQQADRAAATAAYLGKIADEMSEARMREKQPGKSESESDG